MSERDAGLRRRPMSAVPGLTVWALCYLFVGVGLSTAAWWPLYESPRAIVVGAVGGTIGIALAYLIRALRWGPALGAVAAAAAYLVLVVPLAVPAGLSSLPAFLAALRDGVLGVALGWKQILTLAPPLGEYQAVLVPLLVVSLFGGLFAALLALHPGRRAPGAVAVLTAMVICGVAFGVSRPSAALSLGGMLIPAPRELLLGILLLVASLAWSIGRARMQRTAALRAVAVQSASRRGAPVWPAVRRRLLGGVLVAASLVAGLLIAPAAATWSDRSVLRDGIEPMVVVREQPSPLSAYRSWFRDDRIDQTVLRVTGGTGAIDRVRLVALDAYDGQDFHVSPDTLFSRLPRTAADAPGRAQLEITIGEAYRGIWLPSAGELAAAPQFSGARREALSDGFHLGADGGTAITIAPAAGGRGLMPGDRYTVLADAPRGGADDLVSARGGDPELDAETHPALAEWVQLQQQPRTGAGYLELIERLRSRGYLSHALLNDAAASEWVASLQAQGGYSFAASYAGHSAARIEELFSALHEQEVKVGSDASPEMLVAAVGDDEQFAVAAALLARYWGLESRVVLGARLAEAEPVPGIASCTEICTGASMSAWVEVRPAGGEWVALDVTPQFALLPSTIAEGEQLPEHPTVPQQPRSEAVEPPQAQSDSRSDAAPLEQADSPLLDQLLPILRGVGLGVLAALLLMLPLLVVLIAKGVRRRSRHAADDAELRLVGAWEELVDLYADNGIEMEATGTRVQRAQSVERPQAAELARIVDAGVFSPHPPVSADAVTAWAIVDAERAEIGRGSGRRRRLRARLRMRSFLHRIRPARGPALSLRRLTLDTLTGAGVRRQEEDA